jgi:hypothetical protein
MTTTTADQLDAICKRQTARFLDHLRDTGQHTPTLEADFMRSMKFTFKDVKRVVETTSTEAQSHDRRTDR